MPPIQAQFPAAELTGEVPAGNSMRATHLKGSEPGDKAGVGQGEQGKLMGCAVTTHTEPGAGRTSGRSWI